MPSASPTNTICRDTHMAPGIRSMISTRDCSTRSGPGSLTGSMRGRYLTVCSPPEVKVYRMKSRVTRNHITNPTRGAAEAWAIRRKGPPAASDPWRESRRADL